MIESVRKGQNVIRTDQVIIKELNRMSRGEKYYHGNEKCHDEFP